MKEQFRTGDIDQDQLKINLKDVGILKRAASARHHKLGAPERTLRVAELFRPVAERAQTVENVFQFLTARRQGVEYLRARRRFGFASEKVRLLQMAEPLGQNLVGNSRNRSFESAEVKRPMLSEPFHDAARPTASQDVLQLLLRHSL